MNKINKAIRLLSEGNNLVAVSDEQVLTFDQSGIKPIFMLLEKLSTLENFVVADKIVGRAAACIYVMAKVKYLYGGVMSKGAAELLQQNNIDFGFGTLCDKIINRKGDDVCPMEKLIAGQTDVLVCFSMLKNKVMGGRMDKEEFAKRQMFDIGVVNPYGKYFTKTSYLNMLTTGKVPVGFVTFEPGCINNWHSHSGGQILLVTDGEGYYQEWGETARRLKKGDVVEIKPGIKHWHGACKDKWFSHISIEVPGNEAESGWFEPVDQKEYLKLD